MDKTHLIYACLSAHFHLYLPAYFHSNLQASFLAYLFDSFEGEGGFFSQRKTEEVLALEFGQKLHNFLSEKQQLQWGNFNGFLEWFFELN